MWRIYKPNYFMFYYRSFDSQHACIHGKQNLQVTVIGSCSILMVLKGVLRARDLRQKRAKASARQPSAFLIWDCSSIKKEHFGGSNWRFKANHSNFP